MLALLNINFMENMFKLTLFFLTILFGSLTISAKTSNCLAYFEKFHWNTKSQSCQLHGYSGCGPKMGGFDTLQECERSAGRYCKGGTIEFPPPGTIICEAYWETSFWNPKTKSCKLYGYSGCSPNRNGFSSLHECENYGKTYCSLSFTPIASKKSVNIETTK